MSRECSGLDWLFSVWNSLTLKTEVGPMRALVKTSLPATVLRLVIAPYWAWAGPQDGNTAGTIKAGRCTYINLATWLLNQRKI